MTQVPEPELAQYESEDKAAFGRLVNDIHAEFGFAYDPELDADLTDPPAFYDHIWLLKHDDEVVGSVALKAIDGTKSVLKRMYLREELRGHGWGRRLLETATSTAVQQGCTRLLLDTTVRQVSARRLYEQAGFQLIGRQGDSLLYQLELG